MFSEEALILTGAFVACGLLVLGVLELLWPTQPRRRTRVRVPAAIPVVAAPPRPVALASTPEVHIASAPALEPVLAVAASLRLAVEAPAVADVTAEAEPVFALAPEDLPEARPDRPARVHRISALERHRRDRSRRPYLRQEPPAAGLPMAAAEPGSPDVIEVGATDPVGVEAPALARSESLVERCFALHEARRDDEVVVLGMAALQEQEGHEAPADAQQTAALWSVIALARQGLGEHGEARAALEVAIAVAPAADQPAYQRQLASLADGVAAGLLAEADRHLRGASEQRLAAVRAAADWLARGAAATPGDARLVDLAASTETLLWSTYERTVMALVQQQDFRGARRLLREALDDPRFPAGRVEAFHELFSGTFSGEIGQLTAQAIRSVQEGRESDALAALQRAETLLATLSEGALSAKRREEVARRMWWGYSKLGARRLAAGEDEGALAPLFNALDYGVGPDLRQQTCDLLARALDGAAAARAVRIQALIDAGQREAAIGQCDRLESMLNDAVGRGVPVDDLDDAVARVQRLLAAVGAVGATTER